MKKIIHRNDLSFPPKIIALIVVIIFLPVAYLIGHYFGQGTVILIVDKLNGYVVVNGEQHNTPYQTMLPAGRKIISIGAPTYTEIQKIITIPTLRQTKTYTFSLSERPLYDESNAEDESYQVMRAKVIAKYPWAGQLPYEGDDFSIDFPSSDGTFDITLATKEIVIPGLGDAELDKATKAAKQKALAWIKSKGTDPAILKIIWLPYDPDNPTDLPK